MREKEAMQAQQMKRPKKEVWVNSGYNFELTDTRTDKRVRKNPKSRYTENKAGHTTSAVVVNRCLHSPFSKGPTDG